MAASQTQLDALRQALQDLEDALNAAYDNASPDAKDSIGDLTQSISDILVPLEQQALLNNAAQYVKIQTALTAVNKDLKAAQTQINGWVTVVSDADQVAGAIQQVLTLTATVLTA